MKLGIDFDNTIVCYDPVFHAVALERRWVDASTPQAKDAVRNQLRRQGQEEDWIWLQGYVYGVRILDAKPFPGVLDFLRRCRVGGLEVCIISHKTRQPFRGEPHDLHAAARRWLEHYQIVAPQGAGLRETDVFLELTKQDKLARIAACGCDLFIDDLPEFLAEPAFPARVLKVLFDPNHQHAAPADATVIHHWDQADSLLTIAREVQP